MLERIARRLTILLARLALRKGRTPLVRLGSEYGGWWVPLASVKRDWVVYSAGVGEDVTFDEALHARVGCEIHAFDPTPRAAAFVSRRSGLPAGFHFHPWGLWRENGAVRFWAPRDPAHVSHSIRNLQGTATFFEGPVRTVGSTMRALGHTRLDLLKLDIEGAEVEVLREMLASGLRPSVICVELERPGPVVNVQLLTRLRRAGYRLVHLESRNLTLVREGAPGAGGRDRHVQGRARGAQ